METIRTVLEVLWWLTGLYLLLNVAYIFFFALAGHRRLKPQKRKADTLRRICVLLPAYKEDAVIIESAKAAINHAYAGPFDVFVIADGLQPLTLDRIRSLGVGVVEVNFEKSTKGKALQAAMATFPDNSYDIVLVLDADNVMGKSFLEKLNIAFEEGARAVQGHRTAKNAQTPFALLDACNEEINNHIFRRGHHAVGLSSALIGSGMAFEFQYMKHLLKGIETVISEDKEMDIRIGKDQVRTVYLQDAYIYDEKVASAKVFGKQRSRWIYSQIECLKRNFGEGIFQLVRHGNIELFDKVIQTMLLPRILLMGTLTGVLAVSFLLPSGLPPVFWASLLMLAGSALLIALPRRFYRADLWKAMLQLPQAFLTMCLALLSLRKVSKTWVHTPHTQTATEDGLLVDQSN